MISNKSPFNKLRVERYKKAEELCPFARRNELSACQQILTMNSFKRILEIGSGNGFLTKELLNKNLQLDTIDPSGEKINGVQEHFINDAAFGLPSELMDETYDLIISLASFHHIVKDANRLPNKLVADIIRVTKKGGYLIIIDVPSSKDQIDSLSEKTKENASHVYNFFTNIIDKYSTPSHGGIYLNTKMIQANLELYGWEKEYRSLISCPWLFSSKEELKKYLSYLFNLPNLKTINGYCEYIQSMIVESSEGVYLNWALSALVMKKV